MEISGQLAILARHTMKTDFRRIDPRAARVILLDAGERVVAAFSEPTSAKAAKELGDLGVTVREHAMVTDIDARGVTVKVGERDRADRYPDGGLGGRRAHRAGSPRFWRGPPVPAPTGPGTSRSTPT